MIPLIRMYTDVVFPTAVPDMRKFVTEMRRVVRLTARMSAQYAQSVAPGSRLKKEIRVPTRRTGSAHEGGLVADITMPYQLKFTIMPGTQAHYIPGGLKVSTRSEASQIQLQKGYPLSFYWEKVGKVVHFWSVWKKDYPGTDWRDKMVEEAIFIMGELVEPMVDELTSRWGGEVTVGVSTSPAG